MDCPLCSIQLQITDRQGVEIDYCPKCRGVWLDRGELEKLSGLLAYRLHPSPPPPRQPGNDGVYREDRSSGRRDDSGEYLRKEKKESWFSNLFDF